MHKKIIVVDKDSRFRIDTLTRDVVKITEVESIIMQFDHNSERFGFTMPRNVEGHDMIGCDKVEIHFVNESPSGEIVKDKYTVDDLAVDEKDEWSLNFSWLLSGNTCKHNGKLAFSIRFICLKGDTVDYSWGTSVYTAVTVEKGMLNDEAIIVEYPDAFNKIKEELENAFSARFEYITTHAQNAGSIAFAANQNAIEAKGKAEIALAEIEGSKISILDVDISSNMTAAYVIALDDCYKTEKRIIGALKVLGITIEYDVYENDYISSLSFYSGENATTVSYGINIPMNWVGTDCSVETYIGPDEVERPVSIFQPSPNTHYDIIFYFNGTCFVGMVNGYKVASYNVMPSSEN